MPYYIYAFHGGSSVSRLCGSFADYQVAEMCERSHQGGDGSEDVMMIYAQNKTHAKQRIKQVRREKGLSRN